MNASDYSYLKKVLQKETGLSLGNDKEYLLLQRLTPLLKEEGISSISDLVLCLRQAMEARLRKRICDIMTTNETLFFRDRKPFDSVEKEIIPQLLKSRSNSRQLRIWSAASSTGQEAYSIAMILRGKFPVLRNWKIDITATDYSQDALKTAKKGTYSHFEVQRGLPAPMLIQNFKKEDANYWTIKPEIRSMVSFREMNLIKPFPHLGSFDIVFCRNVLIYFEDLIKVKVLRNISQVLRPDGYLFLGGAETILGVSSEFEKIPSVSVPCYRRKQSVPSVV